MTDPGQIANHESHDRIVLIKEHTMKRNSVHYLGKGNLSVSLACLTPPLGEWRLVRIRFPISPATLPGPLAIPEPGDAQEVPSKIS